MLLFDTAGPPIAATAGGHRHYPLVARKDPARTPCCCLRSRSRSSCSSPGTFPASRYLVPLVPFVALFAAIAVVEIWQKQRTVAQVLFVAAFATAVDGKPSRTGAFIRETDTRTLALE